MYTLIAEHLYLYHLETRHFRPLAIGVQSPVSYLIPIWQFQKKKKVKSMK